jgi:hypothetical protein
MPSIKKIFVFFLKIFAIIQTHIIKDRLEMPKVKPDLIHDYHKFVTEVGKHIFGTSRLGHLTSNNEASGSSAEKGGETHKNAEKAKNDKFESLKKPFLAEVNTFYNDLFNMRMDLRDIDSNLHRIRSVGMKIYGNCAGADVEKHLEFFLDNFVVDVHYISTKNGYFMPISRDWKNDHEDMK